MGLHKKYMNQKHLTTKIDMGLLDYERDTMLLDC